MKPLLILLAIGGAYFIFKKGSLSQDAKKKAIIDFIISKKYLNEQSIIQFTTSLEQLSQEEVDLVYTFCFDYMAKNKNPDGALYQKMIKVFTKLPPIK